MGSTGHAYLGHAYLLTIMGDESLIFPLKFLFSVSIMPNLSCQSDKLEVQPIGKEFAVASLCRPAASHSIPAWTFRNPVPDTAFLQRLALFFLHLGQSIHRLLEQSQSPCSKETHVYRHESAMGCAKS